MTPLLALSLVWSWHAFWVLMLTVSAGLAAYRNVDNPGWPFCTPRTCSLTGRCRWRVLRWPVSGRWLLTAFLLMLTLMLIDVCRIAWQAWLNDYPTQITWENIAVRAAPIFIEPWLFWRQWTRGLTNDEPSR